MNKRAILAALPLALGLAACDSTPDANEGDATAATATDDALATDTSIVPPAAANPGDATGTMTAKQLDTTAENMEEQADRVEPTNEAEADRLEAQAKALQDARDARK